ncbi:hypothetical protein C1646_673649 [Rhizophagus diaphanus]|nr:hypothetical protein C1646_673649 [Rhizophagus diaphanus] [Rhizophagus sp. MUCL 43196]
MNKIISITLLLFFIFSSYISAVPNPMIKRQGDGSDPLSGFKPCNGTTYPITFTKFSFDPNPIVIGQTLTTTVAGTSNEEIKEGAIQTTSAFSNGVLVFNQQTDYCKMSVEPTGAKCPLPPGDFDASITSVPAASSNDPSDTTLSFDVVFKIINPDNTELTCMEGPFSITFPPK